MEKGRKLDAAVAKEVFGWQEHDLESLPGTGLSRCRRCHEGFQPHYTKENMADRMWCSPQLGTDNHPPFSTDIAAAWTVVKALRARALAVSVDEGRHGDDLAACVVAEVSETRLTVVASATASSAPHAICLAALRALEARAR